MRILMRSVEDLPMMAPFRYVQLMISYSMTEGRMILFGSKFGKWIHCLKMQEVFMACFTWEASH